MRSVQIIDSMNDLTETLRTERKKRKIVQQNLADVIGVNRRTIIDLEKEDATPLFETVRKAAEALGFRVALVPIEAVNYVEGYRTPDVEPEGEEIGEFGISTDDSGDQ